MLLWACFNSFGCRTFEGFVSHDLGSFTSTFLDERLSDLSLLTKLGVMSTFALPSKDLFEDVWGPVIDTVHLAGTLYCRSSLDGQRPLISRRPTLRMEYNHLF